jgi:outer membrane lipoprotein LolB
MSAARIAAFTIALTAAGCATVGLPPPAAQPFDLSGRVLVSFDARAFSSSLRWQHVAERDELWLLTPLGQAMAHIVSVPEGATVTGADQKQYRGADVEALTRQALGWELPLTRLQYWVRGEPAPGEAPQSASRDGAGRLAGFIQAEWQVRIERYADGQYGGLPHRVELKRAGSESIRLVIDAWRGDIPAR